MKTISQYFEGELKECGLNEEDMYAAMAYVFNRNDKELSDIKQRLLDDVSGYNPMMLRLMFELIKPIVLEWCNETCPEAWFKPVFMSKEQRKELGLDF